MMALLLCSLFLLCWLSLPTPTTSIPLVTLTQQPNTAGYQLLVDDTPWLSSGSLFLSANNRSYSPDDGSLTLLHSSPSTPGSDSLGSYLVTTSTWTTNNSSPSSSPPSAADPPVQLETSIKAYYTLATQPSTGRPPPPVVFT